MEPNLPPGFSSRPTADADVPAIAAFVNHDALAVTGELEIFVDESIADLNAPGFDRERHSRTILSADGTVAAAAELHLSPPWLRNYGWVRVASEFRGRGLGTALTQWLEVEAHEILPMAQPDVELTLECWCYATMSDSRLLLEENGYFAGRLFQMMQITMDAPPPAPQSPPNLVITSTAQRSLPLRAIFDATREAFADHYGYVERDGDEAYAEWEYDTINKYYDPALKFVAFDGDQIAGVSLCLPTIPGEFEMGWVSQLAVRRPWRNQGLARALLLHTFGEFYRAGVTRVGLFVDSESLTGATRLYEQAGMAAKYASVAYRKVMRPGKDLVRRSLEG